MLNDNSSSLSDLLMKIKRWVVKNSFPTFEPWNALPSCPWKSIVTASVNKMILKN